MWQTPWKTEMSYARTVCTASREWNESLERYSFAVYIKCSLGVFICSVAIATAAHRTQHTERTFNQRVSKYSKNIYCEWTTCWTHCGSKAKRLISEACGNRFGHFPLLNSWFSRSAVSDLKRKYKYLRFAENTFVFVYHQSSPLQVAGNWRPTGNYFHFPFDIEIRKEETVIIIPYPFEITSTTYQLNVRDCGSDGRNISIFLLVFGLFIWCTAWDFVAECHSIRSAARSWTVNVHGAARNKIQRQRK